MVTLPSVFRPRSSVVSKANIPYLHFGLAYNTNMSTQQISPTLAPCGIYCGACPSFGKTCLGCAAGETGGTQKRKSKWSCRLRVCCYEEKSLVFCSECAEFPCAKQQKKLMDSHPGDPRYKYRRDVSKNLILLKELGEKEYLKHMAEKFTCPHCGGQVVWYHYRCNDCGEEVFV